MSHQINQIQASYNDSEDRILLKIKTLNEQVYLAWMTRRFVSLLLPLLHGKHPTTGEALFDEQTTMMHQTEKQQTQLEGDFGTAYEAPENAEYPLGERPILLAKMTFNTLNKTQPEEQPQLILEPEQGAGIVLPFNAELMGALLKILAQVIDQADWALQLAPIIEMPAEVRLQ
jgi:hypothetical protein